MVVEVVVVVEDVVVVEVIEEDTVAEVGVVPVKTLIQIK